jgi:NAD(P)-dependent dehydrogenase (short-subunit alcohol dehydrogenase family)
VSAENTQFSLAGKIAVVTGGGSGIGRAISLRFASAGAAIRILDLNLAEAESTVAQIKQSGGQASAFTCDVADQANVGSTLSGIFRQDRIHILVNNAGVSHIGNAENTGEADFDRIIRVNVKGYYNCIHSTVPHMKEKGGVILNIASIAGTAGLADRFAYCTSKGAVVAMTYSVARDFVQHNIRCNCISPGRVHTPFVDGYLRKNYPGRETEMFDKLAKTQPIGRMGEPHEVAALAQYLCSDEASFVTGSDYPLDGGFQTLHG